MENFNYMHINAGLSRVTAAIDIVKEDDVEYAYVGMAFCSDKDQFCKRTGRQIAAGRLDKGKHFYKLPVQKDKKVEQLVQEAFAISVANKETRLPRWLGGEPYKVD
jgi:hypothetical protein